MTTLEQEFLNNAGIFITVCLFLCGVFSLLQIIYPLLDNNYKEKIEDRDWDYSDRFTFFFGTFLFCMTYSFISMDFMFEMNGWSFWIFG